MLVKEQCGLQIFVGDIMLNYTEIKFIKRCGPNLNGLKPEIQCFL